MGFAVPRGAVLISLGSKTGEAFKDIIRLVLMVGSLVDLGKLVNHFVTLISNLDSCPTLKPWRAVDALNDSLGQSPYLVARCHGWVA